MEEEEMARKIPEDAIEGEGRVQKSVTIGATALDEFTIVSRWLKIAPGTFIRQILEDYHRSPTFGALIKRAKGALKNEETEASDD